MPTLRYYDGAAYQPLPGMPGTVGLAGPTGPQGPAGPGVSPAVGLRVSRSTTFTIPTTTSIVPIDWSGWSANAQYAPMNWDTLGAYNQSTGWYTVQVAGKYRVTHQVWANSTAAGQVLQASIVVLRVANGDQRAWANANSGMSQATAAAMSANATCTLDLAVGDQVSAWAASVISGSTLSMIADPRYAWFTLDLVSGVQGSIGPTGPTGAVGPAGGPTGPTGPAAGPYNLVYYQTIPAPKVASNPYTVRHGLGTTFPLVQLWDATTLQQVMAQMTVVDANNVAIRVSSDMPNPVNIVVMGVAGSPVPINPGDYATKAYVDARTPSLPSPITSGSGIQSFTDSLGDVWVAANGVNSGNWKRARDALHCEYYRAASWNTPTALSAVGMNQPIVDAYSLYDPNTGIFSALVAGVWLFNFAVSATATAVNQWLNCILVNTGGSMVAQNQAYVGGAANFTSATTYQRYLSNTETITTKVNASVAMTGGIGVQSSRFGAIYLGTG